MSRGLMAIQETCAENSVKFGQVVFEMRERTEIQSRQTNIRKC